MLNEKIVTDIIDNNAKSTNILIKHYTSIILHLQIRNWIISEIKRSFYKLYYVNSDNFCVIKLI